MDFVDNNIQKVQVQPEDQVYARNEDIKVYGKLVSMSTENVVADSEQIWDEALKKNQSDINSQTQSKFGEYLPLTGGNIDGNLNVDGTVGLNGTLTLGDSLHIEEGNFAFEGEDNESLTINFNGLTYAFDENQSQGFKVKEGDAQLNNITVIPKEHNDTNRNVSYVSPGMITIDDGSNAAHFTPTSIELSMSNDSVDTHVTAKTINTNEVLLTQSKAHGTQTVDTSITPGLIRLHQTPGGATHVTTIQPTGIRSSMFQLTDGTDQDVLLGDGSTIKLGQSNGVAKLDQNGNIPLENLGNLDTQIVLVVNHLPTTDIKTNKIYLIRKSETGVDNTYIEYVYINGSWEKLGEYTPSVDLSNCVKTDESSTINADITVNGKLSSTDANIVIDSGKLELHEGSYGINFISGEDSSYISTTNGNANEYFAADGSIQTIPDLNTIYKYIQVYRAIIISGFSIEGTPVTGVADIPEGIYHNPNTDTFVAKSNNKYYTSWKKNPSKNIADESHYGIPSDNGVKPYVGQSYASENTLKVASQVASDGSVILEDIELPTALQWKRYMH